LKAGLWVPKLAGFVEHFGGEFGIAFGACASCIHQGEIEACAFVFGPATSCKVGADGIVVLFGEAFLFAEIDGKDITGRTFAEFAAHVEVLDSMFQVPFAADAIEGKLSEFGAAFADVGVAGKLEVSPCLFEVFGNAFAFE
jgi:hypothetical protein